MVLSILLAFFAFFQAVRCGVLHKGPLVRRHTTPRVARSENITSLEERDEGARLTYYPTGLGACGTYNAPTDFIVALNAAQYNGGEFCYKWITITVGDKSAQAQIVDECPGCPYLGLDLSAGLFGYFGPLSLGVLTGSWSFGTEPSPSPTPTPTPTPKPSPSSSSIWTPLSTYTPTSTSTSSSVSSTTVSIPTPTPLIPTLEAGNIADLFVAFIQIGSIVTVGRGVVLN